VRALTLLVLVLGVLLFAAALALVSKMIGLLVGGLMLICVGGMAYTDAVERAQSQDQSGR
jgi:hypothetical protein